MIKVKMYGKKTQKKPGGLCKVRFPPKTERIDKHNYRARGLVRCDTRFG